MPRQKRLLLSRIVVKNFFRFIQHETELIDRDGNVGRRVGLEPQTPTVSRCGRDQLVADREAS